MDKLLYPNLRNGLVGAWCPSIDRSRSTLLIDQSGYGNHGTLTNMNPGTDWYARDGKVALGPQGGNTYINLPNRTWASGHVTLGGWVNLQTAGNYPMIFSNNGSPEFELRFYSNSRRPNFNFGYAQTGFAEHSSPNALALNTWAHIVARFDGSTITTWENGVQAISTPCTVPVNVTSLKIGGRAGSFGINAFLDDLFIYNRALTPSEISTLAQRRGIAYETYRVPIVRGASGGGDTFTGTASLTLGGLEFSGAGTAQTPTYEATASLALGGLEFSGTASVDNPTYEATAALTLGGVEFAGAASATVNTFTATAALNLGRLDFAGSASFTAPEYTATASLSLAGIDFAGSAAFSTALRTATVEVEIGGMQFTGSATFQTPVMEASAALVLGGVEFAGADVVLGDTTIFLYYYQMMGVQE